MSDEQRVPATYAIKWKIEAGAGADAVEVIGITFEDLKKNAVRIILHPKEATRFSKALAAHIATASKG
jgi:hypothetical protein